MCMQTLMHKPWSSTKIQSGHCCVKGYKLRGQFLDGICNIECILLNGWSSCRWPNVCMYCSCRTAKYVKGLLSFMGYCICRRGPVSIADELNKIQQGVFMMLIEQVRNPHFPLRHAAFDCGIHFINLFCTCSVFSGTNPMQMMFDLQCKAMFKYKVHN